MMGSRTTRGLASGSWLRTVTFLTLSLTPALARAQYVTLNSSGGIDTDDGIKVYAGELLQMQVERQGATQFYSPASLPGDDDPFSLSLDFRQALAVGSTTYGGSMNQAFSAVSQALTGTGTESDPYVAVTVVNAGTTGVSLRQELRYVYPSDVLTVIVDVTPPSDNTDVIKLYMGGDTYLSGGDNGAAYIEPTTSTPTIVGVTKAGQYMVFIQGDRTFSAYYSGFYGEASSLIQNGGDYDDTLDYDESTDNGMGVEWNLGAITEPTRVSYYLAFTTVASTCGDGVVEGIETCDDGATDNKDGCSSICQIEPGWVCTGQPSVCKLVNGQACTASDQCASGVCDLLGSSTCEPADTCGNGALESGESCDDGNVVDGDGCNATCLKEDGVACSASGECVGVCNPATSQCAPANTCGNGTLESGEGCDDGGLATGDGCNASCLLEDGQGCSASPQCASTVCDLLGSSTCEPANTCGNGKLESGETCDDGNIVDGDGCSSGCLLEDGVACSASVQCASTVCDLLGSHTCEPANTCGNGKLETGESCDDGGLATGDGCNANCLKEDGVACAASGECAGVCNPATNQCAPADTCGNGVVESGESCDDGGSATGDGCNASCLLEDGQSCTASPQCASTVCDLLGSHTCEPANTCGNGVVEAGEACDDGGLATGDGCNASCLLEIGAACGGSGQCASTVCDLLGSHTCEPANTCGNGVVESGESCDDGGVTPGDGCSALCLLENGLACSTSTQCASTVCDLLGSHTCEPANTCGNGKLEAGEACDDGNTLSQDGCSGFCKLEPGQPCQANQDCSEGICNTFADPAVCEDANVCGNGVIETGEVCDDGNTQGGDGCTSSCLLENGESCTANGDCVSGVCDQTESTPTCEPANTCGNGVLEDGEACDDGGLTSGDGCDQSCLLEIGEPCTADDQCASGTCDTLGSHACEPSNHCGNGVLEDGEACDDGNLEDGDGCDQSCLLEIGEPCGGDTECASGVCGPSQTDPVCVPAGVCGNGVLDSGEACDDGNLDDGDGCSSGCLLEDGQACTDDAECVGVCDTLQSNRCEPVDTCGNGALEDGEACDDGNNLSHDGCTGFCKLEPGQPCQDNQDCSEGICNTSADPAVCESADTCGNGVVETGEVCDDGNTQGGDGCTSGCLLENGEACTANGDCDSGVCDQTGNTPTCEPADTCGNGVVETGESCDDGNTQGGDGCTSGCLLENSEACTANDDCDSGVCDQTGDTPTCEPADTCGNGVLEDGEACDDGNLEDGDGCSRRCAVEEEEVDNVEPANDGDLVGGGGAGCSVSPASPRSHLGWLLLLGLGLGGAERSRRRRSGARGQRASG